MVNRRFRTSLPNMEQLVSLRGIRKTFSAYSGQTEVLRGIDLDIDAGEWLSIIGPSGAGKTTLLKIMGLLDEPTSGVYRLGGTEVGQWSMVERQLVRLRSIGFVFQDYSLIPDLSVSENIELPLTFTSKRLSRKRLVREAVLRVGLEQREGYRPGQLSGGQQQRAALARAIANNPTILFADEPTGSLDNSTSEHVMGILRGLHDAGTTICTVTHDEKLLSYASRVLEIRDGLVATQ